MPKKGFTLVEAIIVIVVIVAIMAVLIPILRERERQRLQAVADAYSRDVFEFRAEPAKESFAEGEEIIVHCEIVNPTGYPLTLREVQDNFHLIFGDTKYFVGYVRLQDSISQTAIAPHESVSFDVTLRPIGTGAAEVRIVYGKGIAYWSASGNSSHLEAEHIGVNSQGVLEYRNIPQTIQVKGRSRYILVHSRITLLVGAKEYGNLRGILSTNGKRFQSQTFSLVINENDSSELPTFDEVVAETKQWESSR